MIDEKFRKLGNIKHALIDSDYFVEFDLSLDYQKVEDLLMALHLNVSEAFKKSCSPFAKERWA